MVTCRASGGSARRTATTVHTFCSIRAPTSQSEQRHNQGAVSMGCGGKDLVEHRDRFGRELRDVHNDCIGSGCHVDFKISENVRFSLSLKAELAFVSVREDT